MKLRCDGSSPCSSCQRRNLVCNNERKSPSKGHELGSQKPPSDNKDTKSTRHDNYEQPSDRGSIKFLLNGGMDSFTEQFRLPPSTDRARGLEYHNQKGVEEAERSILEYPVRGSNQSIHQRRSSNRTQLPYHSSKTISSASFMVLLEIRIRSRTRTAAKLPTRHSYPRDRIRI